MTDDGDETGGTESSAEEGRAGPPTDEGTASAESQAEPEEGSTESPSPARELVDRVAEAEPVDVASEIAALQDRADAAEDALAECREEVEDLESRLKRKQADFENYKKRMDKRREQERKRATEDLVERLLEVRDNLVRALEQDADADVRGGVEATLRGFDDVLEDENVEPIEPTPGEDLDPQRHEALMRVESEEPPGTVHAVHRPGYEMAGTVLRPAQVTVSDDE